MRTYFDKLTRISAIKEICDKVKVDKTAILQAHKETFHLHHAPKGIMGITFYELSEPRSTSLDIPTDSEKA